VEINEIKGIKEYEEKYSCDIQDAEEKNTSYDGASLWSPIFDMAVMLRVLL
jgi:hypothetical protein